MTPLRILFLLILFIFIACSSDPGSSNNDIKVSQKGAFIINEGNYSKSNGSLSFYDTFTDSVSNNIFFAVNNRSLGDVVQSAVIVDSLLFIAVNNSAKIEVISINTWKQKVSINLAGNPRFLARAGQNKIYVTCWFPDGVEVIDLNTFNVTKTIKVGNKPENLIKTDNRIFVTNSGWGAGKTISVINPDQDYVIDSIMVGDNPGRIALDVKGMLHVLCGGYTDYINTNNDTPGGIYKIDPVSLEVTDSLILSEMAGALRYNLVLDSQHTGYFSWQGKIASYDTETLEIVNPAFLEVNHYAFNYNIPDDHLYITDAKNLDQNGDLKIFNLSGDMLAKHSLGIIPGEIIFTGENK